MIDVNKTIKMEVSTESLKDAKLLLIPAKHYLTTILDCQKNNK